MASTEGRALIAYTRTVRQLFLDWKATTAAFHQTVQASNDNAELQQHLDRLHALRADAIAMAPPPRAATLQRTFESALESGERYFQHLFSDADEAVIGQDARDDQEELAMFLTAFDMLVGNAGQSLQGPHAAN